MTSIRKPVVSRTVISEKFVCDIYDYEKDAIIKDCVYYSHKRFNPDKIIEQATKEISAELDLKTRRLIRITSHKRVKINYEQDLDFFIAHARTTIKNNI